MQVSHVFVLLSTESFVRFVSTFYLPLAGEILVVTTVLKPTTNSAIEFLINLQLWLSIFLFFFFR